MKCKVWFNNQQDFDACKAKIKNLSGGGLSPKMTENGDTFIEGCETFGEGYVKKLLARQTFLDLTP